MSFLGDEIAKLKRQAPAEKYLKRSDLEAERLAAYEARQEALKRKRDEAEMEKLEALKEREAKRYKPRSSKPLEPAQVAEMRKALIELNEPIVLFGESHQDSLERLENIRAVRERASNSNEAIIATAYRTDNKLEMVPLDKLQISMPAKPGQLISFIRGYLDKWKAYQKEEGEERRYNTARQHLARLIMRLQANNLPEDVLKNLTLLGRACLKGDFSAANLSYLNISIGNAAWPVGLTYTGVHERAQRERKSHEVNTAHVLDDESTRQWLQSLKRLMTFIEKQA